MSYPDVFLYHWIGMSTQTLSPHFLEQGLKKRPYTRLGSVFQANLGTLNSIQKITS